MPIERAPVSRLGYSLLGRIGHARGRASRWAHRGTQPTSQRRGATRRQQACWGRTTSFPTSPAMRGSQPVRGSQRAAAGLRADASRGCCLAPATALLPVRCSAPARADTAERGATVAATDSAEALTVAIDIAVPFDVKARQRQAWLSRGLNARNELFVSAITSGAIPIGNRNAEGIGCLRKAIKTGADPKSSDVRSWRRRGSAALSPGNCSFARATAVPSGPSCPSSISSDHQRRA